jgi:hypothetical protein
MQGYQKKEEKGEKGEKKKLERLRIEQQQLRGRMRAQKRRWMNERKKEREEKKETKQMSHVSRQNQLGDATGPLHTDNSLPSLAGCDNNVDHVDDNNHQ